jgi:hypothetical protein
LLAVYTLVVTIEILKRCLRYGCLRSRRLVGEKRQNLHGKYKKSKQIWLTETSFSPTEMELPRKRRFCSWLPWEFHFRGRFV